MLRVLFIALITTAFFSCHNSAGSNRLPDSTVTMDTNATKGIDTVINETGKGVDSTVNGTGANSLSGMDSIKH